MLAIRLQQHRSINPSFGTNGDTGPIKVRNTHQIRSVGRRPAPKMHLITAIVALLARSCAIAVPITPPTAPYLHQSDLAIVKGALNEFGGASLSNLEPLAALATDYTMALNGGRGAEWPSDKDDREVRRSSAGFSGGLLTGGVNSAIATVVVVVVLEIVAFGKEKQG